MNVSRPKNQLIKMSVLPVALLFFSAAALPSHAIITQVSNSTPTATGPGGGFFSDGGSDYFGIVDNTGNFIQGVGFTATDTTPPAGALAGRDLDDGNTRPGTRTAEWELNIASIAGAVSSFTNILFSGTIAAGPAGWDNFTGSSVDFVTLELLQDGVVLASETKDFRSTAPLNNGPGDLALDTNGDGVGDAATVSISGQNFSLTGTTASSTVVVRMTAHSDASGAEFWVSGNLTADVDIIPEPSSSLMLIFGSGLLMIRRRR